MMETGKPRVHNLAPDHKRSPHNPGADDPSIADNRLAYRTARCGVVFYSRIAINGRTWVWQNLTTIYCESDPEEVTCKTCRRLMQKEEKG